MTGEGLALESLLDGLPSEPLLATFSLDPLVVAVILAMTAVTVLTKVGGIWLVRRVELSERLEAGLNVLPGAIVIAVLGPELAAGGPAEWGAAGLVLVVMWRTESILLALCTGVVAVVAFRGLV
ncbi:AzlD family protein [Natronorubrum halophilum]|uniref:AzlD family protein n=1 Tax=Natronorubrum halophilum TaxID=1702106 RepID=UPI0010C20315|nr:AzlD domain-containing protein [Natronorubrum halophilum]